MAKKYPVTFVIDEDMKRTIDESPIRKAFGTSNYVRAAISKFSEIEQCERKANEKSNEKKEK